MPKYSQEMIDKLRNDWQPFERKGTIEARPYIPGEALTGVSVSDEDTPEEGGMIARNPDNPNDQWYINPTYFAKNYAPTFPRQHIPTGNENKPAFSVIEEALNSWSISGFPPIITVEHDETVARTLHNRNFDVPSVVDHIVEALKDAELL